MNTATYKNNGNNKYPVSTDTLDFIQEQIKLIYNLTDLYGKYYILRAATATTDGLIVWNGELMPLRAGSAQDYIALREQRITVTAAGVDYDNARIVRYAEYTSVNEGSNCLDYDEFTSLITISALQAEVDEAKRHHTPKGTVIDYYGSPLCDDLPYGWIPCALYNKVSGSYSETPPAITAEVNKWKARYGSLIQVSGVFNYGPNYWFVRITNCNGVAIPNLSTLFTVGAGCAFDNNGSREYALGETGGANSVTLTTNQMPSHSHVMDDYTYAEAGGDGTNNMFGTNGYSDNDNGAHSPYVHNTRNSGGGQAHENRPPFFALYKLIKVI